MDVRQPVDGFASRRGFVSALLPGLGLVWPVRIPVFGARTMEKLGASDLIAWSDLPSGSGTWSCTAATISGALIVGSDPGTSNQMRMVGSAYWYNSAADTILRLATGSTSKSPLTRFSNETGGKDSYVGMETSGGNVTWPGTSPYALVLWHGYNNSIQFGTNNTLRATIDGSGLLTAKNGVAVSAGGVVIDITTEWPFIIRDNPSAGEFRFDLVGQVLNYYLGPYGSPSNRMSLSTSSLAPATAGGLGLGTTSNPWSELNTQDGTASAPSIRVASEATGLYKVAAGQLGFTVSGYGALMMLKNTDGNPEISPITYSQQLSLGEKGTGGGGYILLNGLNYSTTEKGDVLITGNTQSSAAGDVKIRKWDGTSVTDNATFKADGTLIVGAPSGTVITGAGKINVSGDVYKNGTAYNNPDYVFETAYEGAPRSPAPDGYRVRSLAEVEQFTRQHLHLPGISREASGMFARADMLLEKVEELYLHAFELSRRLTLVESENRALRTQVEMLSTAVVP